MAERNGTMESSFASENIRAERERTIRSPDAADIEALVAAAREDALSAGAASDSLDVRVEADPERSLLRAVATGSVVLHSGSTPGRPPIGREEAARLLTAEGCDTDATSQGSFWWALDRTHAHRHELDRLVVLDRFGDIALDERGVPVMVGATVGHDELRATIESHTRHLGPMSLPPTVWVLAANQLLEIGSGDIVATVIDIVGRTADGDAALVLVTKER